MIIDEIRDIRVDLINDSNPEWFSILKLRREVQKEFNKQQYLSIETFTEIIKWKLRNQKPQVDKIRKSLHEPLIQNITNSYFKSDYPNEELDVRIKVHILLSIPWIGIHIATAILAFHKPQSFGNIDSYAWKTLFKKEKVSFTIKDYLLYHKTVRELADELNCDVQEIDYMLWKISFI